MKNEFYKITESPGQKSSAEQLERLYQRYTFAKKYTQNKVVLEVACGGGMGLGYLASDASKVFGLDIDQQNVDIAKRNCNLYKNVHVDLGDVISLPYEKDFFDVVIIFEAIYYFPNFLAALQEIKRVLKKDGMLIISSVNCEWEDFHPSDYVAKYYSLLDLKKALESCFANNEFYGGFQVDNSGIRKKVFSFVKKIAVKFHLIPGSLKARAYLKRVFMGKLLDLPTVISNQLTDYVAPTQISQIPLSNQYKILYSVSSNKLLE